MQSLQALLLGIESQPSNVLGLSFPQSQRELQLQRKSEAKNELRSKAKCWDVAGCWILLDTMLSAESEFDSDLRGKLNGMACWDWPFAAWNQGVDGLATSRGSLLKKGWTDVHMKQTWKYSHLWPCVKAPIRIGIAKPLTVFWFWWRQKLLPSCCFHQTSKDFLDNLSQLLLRNHCRNYSGLVLDMCSLGEAPGKLTNDMKSFTFLYRSAKNLSNMILEEAGGQLFLPSEAMCMDMPLRYLCRKRRRWHAPWWNNCALIHIHQRISTVILNISSQGKAFFAKHVTQRQNDLQQRFETNASHAETCQHIPPLSSISLCLMWIERQSLCILDMSCKPVSHTAISSCAIYALHLRNWLEINGIANSPNWSRSLEDAIYKMSLPQFLRKKSMRWEVSK